MLGQTETSLDDPSLKIGTRLVLSAESAISWRLNYYRLSTCGSIEHKRYGGERQFRDGAHAAHLPKIGQNARRQEKHATLVHHF